MRTILLIAFLSLLSCEREQANPVGLGCQSGLHAGYSAISKRVVYRCSTYEQFLAGSDTSKGGTAEYNNYVENQWTPCTDCKVSN